MGVLKNILQGSASAWALSTFVKKSGDTMTGPLSVPEVIVGDAGTEGSGINIGGITFESSFKVSDIDGTNYAQTILHRHSTVLEPLIVGARSNSDTSAHADVTAGQNVFSVYGTGWAGSNYKIFGSASFSVDSTGTISNTSSPGKFSVSVTPDGAVVPVEAFKITNDKNATFFGNAYFTSNTESLSATKTLVATSPQYQFLNPNGSNRDVTLPAAATNMLFIIKNTGSAGNTLTVKDSGGTAVSGGTIANTVTMGFYYNGSSWQLV